MIEFLTSLLVLVLSLAALNHSPLDPAEIVAVLEEKIAQVESPEANPTVPSLIGNEAGEDGAGM